MDHGITNPERFIAIMSKFGVGMLLGTSFMLVIPEGIKSCVEHDGNVGLNLLIGFLAVYLLDRLVQIVIKRNSADGNESIENAAVGESFSSLRDIIQHPKRIIICILRNNVVFALVIHGLSDGIALGTTINNESLLLVVLIAIVINKIPAVLSLTSIMISKQKLPRWEVMSNLFAFSLSTPLGYVVLSMFNLKQSDTMDWLSGNLLLMSGGSLLYASFTAFVDGSEHDHSMPKELDSSLTTEEDIEQRWDLRDEEVNMNSNYNESGAKNQLYDDSVYIVSGVIIPTVISYIISED